MSLFKVRELWSTTCGNDENFDQGCLCIANIDNSTEGTDKIIVGSFEGVLRIFGPRMSTSDDPSNLDKFKPDDLFLEAQLNSPILQLQAGAFTGVKEKQKLSLAILHPRKIAVYNISAIPGAVDHGTHYHLSLSYEHSFKRSAFCFVGGPFGKISGKDFLCVQSLDGTLSFYEQDSFAFTQFLPGFLLPGPLCYCLRMDSLITISSSWQLESYKYQSLAAAIETNTKDEETKGKRVTCDWSVSLGEAALDLAQCPSQNLIFVLGERNLFCYKDSGVFSFMKRLDHTTLCFCPYTATEDGRPFLLEATASNTLRVYQEVTLRWAAQMSLTPIAVKRASFLDLRGILVFLSEQGQLMCGYLGTSPIVFVPPSVESRQVDYSQSDLEMGKLQKIIKTSQTSKFIPSVRSDMDLGVNVTIAKNLDSASVENTEFDHEVGHLPAVAVQIQLRTVVPMHDVRVTIQVSKPLFVSHSLFTFPSVVNSVQVVVSIYLREVFVPCDLSASVIAVYHNRSGVPQVVVTPFRLPLVLVAKSCLPLKEAQHKITLNTNRPAVSLTDLFPDMADANSSTSQAMGFEYYSGQIVTVLAAKTSQRYRLQSDNFDALWLIASELLRRLKERFSTDANVLFSYSSNIPVQELFTSLDAHFGQRLEAVRLQEQLGHRAAQFRAIQRRLLMKFKSKTPVPLDNLDVLLEGTYRQLLTLIESTERNERRLEATASSICCSARMIALLLRLLTGMNQKETDLLESAMSHDGFDSMEQGWEEIVDAAVTHLLHTALAKPGKEQVSMPVTITTAKDTSRLKKHLLLMIERVSKGGHLQVKDGEQNQSVKNPTFVDEDRIPDGPEGDAINPLLPKMGGRLSSAKGRPQTAVLSESEKSVVAMEEKERPVTAVSVEKERPLTAMSVFDKLTDGGGTAPTPEIVTSTYEDVDDVIAF